MAVGAGILMRKSSTSCDDRKNYKIVKKLGSGTFATVYKALDQGTGEAIAFKEVKFDDGCIQREIAALHRIQEHGDHPNVAGMRGYEKNWLATELVDGCELFDYLVRNGSFTEKQAADCFQGVFSAMAKLHEWRVVHADVKPENLVLSRDRKTVKLVDFGSALLDGATPQGKDAFRYGTPWYLPPELLKAKLEKNPQQASESFQAPADAWALGVVLYIALLGCHPFDPENDLDTEEAFSRAVSNAYHQNLGCCCKPLDRAKPVLSPAAFDLLSSLLHQDPKKRATLETCLGHPWFNGAAGTDQQLDHLAKNLAKWRRFKHRLEATALDTLVARAERRLTTAATLVNFKDEFKAVSDETHETTTPPNNKGFDDALTGLLDAVLVTDDEEKKSETRPCGTTETTTTLPRAMVEDVLSSLRTVDLGQGDTVFNYGDDASTDAAEMFFIHTGEVAVVRHGTRVATLKAGEFFGEGSIVAPKRGHTRRSATVTVTQDAKLVAISRRDVQRSAEIKFKFRYSAT